MDNDLTFFTNEPDRDLYSRFTNILKSNTQFFDVLVGYFRTSGFFKLYPAMQSVEKIRILVGLNVDNYTVKIINRSQEEITYESISVKDGKGKFIENVENEFANSFDSFEIEEGVKTFVDWLKIGKLEIRIYTEAPVHAKVYIMRKNPEKVLDMFGSVITGSSNFSAAGLQNNLEFNVELKDSRDVKFALGKFEELWEKSSDITAEYIATINEKTWLRDDISPFEIFLKTLYEFFKEEINSDKDKSMENLLPDGFMRLQYQIDAVVQARKILEAYNGVFISDVVGLGKTFICAMLAKSLRGGKKLVICPPVLVDYWQGVLLDFDVSARVESLGKLQKLIDEGVDKYEYVFVDEAHRFRNQDTESFNLLHQICYGKKVVLISATPINNYSSDIENQLYLFQAKRASTIIPNNKDLQGYFAKLNTKLLKYKKGTPEYILQLRANSESIRDEILRHVMVRRTRTEINQYYKSDLEKQGLSFPKMGSPEQIIYEFDDITNDAFNSTMNVIARFGYSRYMPLTFLRDTSKYATMLAAQRNMGGFMAGILIKRLESSFYAFKMTLSRFVESYEKFIDMYNMGDVWISKKVDVYDLLDNGDDAKLLRLVEEESAMHFKSYEFVPEFLEKLNDDLKKLKYLKNMWDGIVGDPKLEQFQHEMDTNIKLQGKKIIFTESKETAEYLGKKLKDVFGSRVVWYSSESGPGAKQQIEDSFNPKFEHKNNDKYDVLITTDVLAEGVNLHKAGVLINYDLPWNPTRIMQRAGRINRVGTAFDRIYIFNFFPTAQSSKHLSLKDRILEKLQAFHDTLGEDSKYLSDEEEINSYKLYDELTKDLDAEEEGANPELAYLQLIREIRDKDEKLFERIKRLPIKARTAKLYNGITDTATLSFIRKGALKLFFMTNTTGTAQLSFMEAIKYLEAKPNDMFFNVDKSFFNQLNANTDAFDYKLIEEEIITAEKVKIGGNDLKIMNTLKALMRIPKFTDEEEDVMRELITIWESGEINSKISKDIIKGMPEDPMEAFYFIKKSVPNSYSTRRSSDVRRYKNNRQIILSCYLKEGDN